MDEENIVQEVVSALMSDTRNSFPYYREDILSEKDAEVAVDLPLVYIWNQHEVGSGGLAYAVSVNGKFIGQELEKHLPRSDPEFAGIRKHIITTIAEAQNRVVTNMCKKFCCTPMQLAQALPR